MAKVQKQIPYTHYENAVKLYVESLNEYGEGIAHADGYEIYLKGAIDGEEVLCKIGEPFANGSKRRPGQILQILKSSPDRAESFDEESLNIYPYAHLTYEGTLKRKQAMIDEAVMAAVSHPCASAPIEQCDISHPCRFKSVRYFASQNGRVFSGFYKMRTHDVAEVKSCLFEPEWFSQFSVRLCEQFTSESISVYDEFSLKGTLRSLLLRDTLDGRLCVLNVNESSVSDFFKQSYLKVASDFNVDAVYINYNQSSGNSILLGRMEALTDSKSITLKLDDISYNAGPYTFLQVNYPVAKKLYARAVEFCAADTPADSHALDLCCGCGTMSLMLAKRFRRVTGVEIVQEAVEAARENALLNGIDNASFIAGDITDIIPSLVRERGIHAVICDPSRAGLGEANCRALSSVKGPLKIAFIFCSLKALKRDVRTLCKCGFEVEQVQGFDMFPYTSHIETMVLMSRKGS